MGRKNTNDQKEYNHNNDNMESLLNGLEALVQRYKTSKAQQCNPNDDKEMRRHHDAKSTKSRWSRIDHDDDENGHIVKRDTNKNHAKQQNDHRHNDNPIRSQWYKINDSEEETKHKSTMNKCPEKTTNLSNNGDLVSKWKQIATTSSESEDENQENKNQWKRIDLNDPDHQRKIYSKKNQKDNSTSNSDNDSD